MFGLNKLPNGLFLVSALASCQVLANNSAPLVHPLKLNQATIFLRGAELTNSASIDLPQGQSTVILTNVARSLNKKSLSISLDNDDVLIRSIDIKTAPIEPVYSPEVVDLKKQIAAIEQQISELNIQIKIGEEQLELLRDQRFFGENSTLSLEQSASKLEFIRKQMSVILNENLTHQHSITEKTEARALLQAKLDAILPSDLGEQTQIILDVDTPKSLTSKIQIAYLTPDAGWSPSYDIRAKGINAPLTITYKADIIQNTGIRWDQVTLMLSSVNPTTNITPPSLSPWFLSIYNDQINEISQNRIMMEMSAPAAAPAAEQSDFQAKRSTGIANFVSTNNNGVNLNYSIALPYSLDSSPQPKSITIKQAQVDAKYRYTSTPKLAPDVYLQAQISHWDNLNLLNGPANIYFDNSYVGSYSVNSAQLTDTLDIPFGIDKNIQITRTRNETLRKKPSFIGSIIKQKESYLIKVKNTRKDEVNLVIYDQVPVSQDSDVKVAELEYKNAQFEPTAGTIEWNLTLKPQQDVELPLSYTLEYPKDKLINGL